MSDTLVEAAYKALLAALSAKADEADVLPAPKRNALLVTAFSNVDGSLTGEAFLNVLDDDGDPVGELAGGDAPDVEFWQRARIEWVVERKNDAERDALFDAGLQAIRDGLLEDRTLSGAVDDLMIDMPVRRGVNLAGAPRLKAAVIPVRLLLTASSYIG